MIAHGKKIKIFTGNSHPELAKEIADLLGFTKCRNLCIS